MYDKVYDCQQFFISNGMTETLRTLFINDKSLDPELTWEQKIDILAFTEDYPINFSALYPVILNKENVNKLDYVVRKGLMFLTDLDIFEIDIEVFKFFINNNSAYIRRELWENIRWIERYEWSLRITNDKQLNDCIEKIEIIIQLIKRPICPSDINPYDLNSWYRCLESKLEELKNLKN